jgi:hypothetical protein
MVVPNAHYEDAAAEPWLALKSPVVVKLLEAPIEIR